MDHERDAGDDEKRLLERFRGGDRSAFDEIVARHRLAVYRVARRILGSHHDADDATQETFVRAWRALAGFRGESRLGTWLIRIALNVSRTAGAGREAASPLEHAAELAGEGEPADEAAERHDAGRRVRRAVAQLPPRQREVVALKAFSDLTYEEVAAAMGLTVGAVKAHFHQAVSNLKRHMSNDGAGEGTP